MFAEYFDSLMAISFFFSNPHNISYLTYINTLFVSIAGWNTPSLLDFFGVKTFLTRVSDFSIVSNTLRADPKVSPHIGLFFLKREDTCRAYYVIKWHKL